MCVFPKFSDTLRQASQISGMNASPCRGKIKATYPARRNVSIPKRHLSPRIPGLARFSAACVAPRFRPISPSWWPPGPAGRALTQGCWSTSRAREGNAREDPGAPSLGRDRCPSSGCEVRLAGLPGPAEAWIALVPGSQRGTPEGERPGAPAEKATWPEGYRSGGVVTPQKVHPS